jgi:hypothetical protein
MFKNSFNLKGYGFDVFGTTDLAGFDANIANGYYAIAQNTLILKNALADGVDGGWNPAELNVGQLALYVQDEWNINDDFKLIYG